MTTNSLESAIIEFVRDLQVAKSPYTVRTYMTGLARFSQFLARAGVQSTGQLTVDHFIQFARDLKKQKVAGSSLETYLAAVRRFYRFLSKRGDLELSVRDQDRLGDALQEFRERRQRLPKALPDEVVRQLIQAASVQEAAVPSRDGKLRKGHDSERAALRQARNVAIVHALRASGMRVGELIALKRGDLDYRTRSARIIGKGNKERVVFFDESAWQAIHAYLKLRRDGLHGRALAEAPLFARHDRRAGDHTLPLTTQRVEQIFNDLAKQAGLDPSPTPHALRHTFATRVLEASGDLAAVQDLLGHASPTTTRIYAKVSAQRLREVHRAAFEIPH